MAGADGVSVAQQWEEAPYRGLETFDLEHAPIFFGREEQTGDVVEALQTQADKGCAFVLVVGAQRFGQVLSGPCRSAP